MTRTHSGKVIPVFLAAVALAGLVQSVTPQQSTPKSNQDDVIRVDTSLIQVRAVVTDRAGKLVDNLKQDEFEILENGHPQSVSFFSAVRIENRSSATMTGQKALPRANQPEQPSRDTRPARSIILVVDTLHLSIPNLMRAKQQLKQFVEERITDEDLVAIVTTSGSLGVLQQFMRDRKMLKYAIDKIMAFQRPASLFTPYLAAQVLTESPGGPIDRSLPRTVSSGSSTGPGALGVATRILAEEEFSREAPPPPDFVRGRARQILAEESLMRRTTWEVVKAASDQMAQMPGQRMMAFMSEGFTMLSEGGGADHLDFTAATSRAVRSGVVVYSFSPQGLTVPVEFTAASVVSGPDFGRYMADGRVDQQQTLRSLAGDTGGEAYLNSNDVVGQFKKMLDANSVYYAMAYYPQEKGDKKYRSIKVRVKNHPEYSVRTQRGYQPATEKKPDVAATPQQRLLQAMIAPLPLTAIGITSSASFLERGEDDATVTLQLHFDGGSLGYPEQDKKFAFNCELAVVILDRTGSISNTFIEGVNAVFTPEQLDKARRNGYRYSKRLNLAPGLYQLRVGVRDKNSGLIGTALSWVEVSDLHNRKLTLSNLFLGKEKQEEEAEITTTAAKKSAQPTLVIGPASFKSGETVSYRFVLYNAAPDTHPTAGLTLKVEVLEAGATVYEGPWQPVAPRIIRSDRLGLEMGGQIRMAMSPGIYTLRLSIKDRDSGQTVRQTIDIELEP